MTEYGYPKDSGITRPDTFAGCLKIVIDLLDSSEVIAHAYAKTLGFDYRTHGRQIQDDLDAAMEYFIRNWDADAEVMDAIKYS